MRIKSDVEFVKKECIADESIDWCDSMECRCGENVVKIKNESETKLKCFFSDGDWWYYPLSCIEGLTTLEKGKKYTINSGINVFEFVEESENFAIFEGGIVFKKDGNEFVDVVPMFLKKEWRVERRKDDFVVYCGQFGICTIGANGLYPNKNLSLSLGFPLDENDAIKIVTK